ncbi:MAG: hypothetical protein A2X82_18040 [Geobacteraceae bacterium GWC2_55_20]|nr:MAG: hypothetical protein A2X82_18040 [Geobacteraceae bacterium GWC2_55_20]OGU26503.1 MAG: hypothetical protein A2X85_09655 [Geobacteraceae bacterium GWF2_54_21]HBA73107.1 hypothetical protein [Geobacter sp.]HCE67781.1 hypothetical protein [Geobacter sp.]
MKRTRFNQGFTLIEVIVVAAIIAILAGVLVPMIFNQIDESKVTRALGDVKAIQSSVLAFRKDTGLWPKRDSATTDAATILQSAGNMPLGPGGGAVVGWDVTTPVSMNDLLVTNGPANAGWYTPKSGATSVGWNGPYGTDFPADPWGNMYVINVNDFGTSGVRVFIVSAGADGNLDTELPGDTAVHSNDIGVVLNLAN